MARIRLTSVGVRRQFRGPLHFATQAFAVIIGGWTFYAAVFAVIDVYLLSAIFLCSMLTLAFLYVGWSESAHPTRPSVIDVVLSLCSLSSGIYIVLNSDRIVQRIANLDPLSSADMVVGIVLLILSMAEQEGAMVAA
jgi:TRAP-type uncharacterized transport system fused permease subunit